MVKKPLTPARIQDLFAKVCDEEKIMTEEDIRVEILVHLGQNALSRHDKIRAMQAAYIDRVQSAIWQQHKK